MEELHVKISVGDPFAVFTYTNEVKGSHSIEVVYFAKFAEPAENIKLNSEDHSEFRWVVENEMQSIAAVSKEERVSVMEGFALLRGEAHLFG